MPINADGFWVPDLFGRQWDVFNSTSRALLVSGNRLAAKCVDADTIIPCDGKLLRISSVAPGLLPNQRIESRRTIVAFDATASKFLYCGTRAIWRSAEKKGLEIVTNSGYRLRCSTWHPVWTLEGGTFSFRRSEEIASLLNSGREVWVPIKLSFEGWTETANVRLVFDHLNGKVMMRCRVHAEIRKNLGDRQPSDFKNISAFSKAAKTNWSTAREYLRSSTPSSQCVIELDEDLAYVIGLLVGDGGMTPSVLKAHRIGFTTADPELLESLTRVLSSKFSDFRLRKSGKYGYDISSSKLRSLIVHLGLNTHSTSKVIPGAIISSPKPIVRAFLQGLFDTDACATLRGTVEYCSASSRLAEDVQQILLAFGIRSGLHFSPNKCHGAWKVCIWSDAPIFFKEIGFRLTRKQQRVVFSDRLSYQFPSAYPDSIRPLLKSLYLSRHSRGAVRGNLPRSKRGEGFSRIYQNGALSVSLERLPHFVEFACCQDDVELQKYRIDGKVFWEKIKSVSPCNTDLYDLEVPDHQSFVSAGFISHNSVAVLNKICKHLWDVPDARVAIFARILKHSKDAGQWKNLEKRVLPQWIGSGIGMRFTTQNRYSKEWGIVTDGQTRTSFFRVTNRHGGEGTCLLYSLDDDNEAELRLRDAEFSLIYFSELSNFTTRDVLSLGLPCLRMQGLRFDQQQWIADTNPSEEMEASWIYKVWFVERCQSYEEYAEERDKLEVEALGEREFTLLKSHLGLIEMFADENERLSPEQLAELKQLYPPGSEEYLRFVVGTWISGTGGDSLNLLRRYFRPSVHLVGTCEGAEDSQWELALPSENCVELVTGWDPGHVNHAAVILEREIKEQYLPTKKITAHRSYFTLLDECVTLDEAVGLEPFTDMVMEKIEELERTMGRELKLNRNWVDPTALTHYNASTQTYPYLVIHYASGGRISLEPATSKRYSVGLRLQILRQLLAQERLKISAHCEHTIRMLKELRRGKNRGETVSLLDKNKHIFDALTYPLLEECKQELDLDPSFNVGKRQQGGIVLSVR